MTEALTNEILDQVRGVLVALANRGDDFFHPTSTLSIRMGLTRRNRSIAPADALHVLYSIGDVQRLSGGCWLPVPTVLIPFGGASIVVSGYPTPTLARVFHHSVTTKGFSRVVPLHVDSFDSLPNRSFDEWSGLPRSSLDWTGSYVRRASFSQEFVDDGLEFFDHWSKRTHTRWIDRTYRIAIPNGVVLGRLRSPSGTLFLLCRMKNGAPDSVHEVGHEWTTASRLAFGLRATHDNRPTFRLDEEDNDDVSLTVTRYLPDEELMVLRALGSIDELSPHRLRVVLSQVIAAQIAAMLLALGLQQEQ